MLDIERLSKDIVDLTIEFYIKSGGLQRGKKVGFHNDLQRELIILSKKYGMQGGKEHFINDYDNGRNGYIDIVWKLNNVTILLLEIDSSPRVKSVKKLLAAKSAYKIWLYYGKKSATQSLVQDLNNEIYLIHLPFNIIKCRG